MAAGLGPNYKNNALEAFIEVAQENAKIKAVLKKVMAFHHGTGKYNFTHLTGSDRDQVAFHAWEDIKQEIDQILNGDV